MSADLMYSPLEYVFESTMQREGKVLTAYSNGTEFRAFFRIHNDNDSQRETVVIYYDTTAPVHSGTLVMIGNEIYIALNRETVENDVYYKSTLVKCNGIFNGNDGSVSNVHFYSDNVKSSLSIGNNVISVLNGNIEFLTEDNPLSGKIRIDHTFNEFGRTFKVTNKYSIDGIMHITAEIDADKKPDFVYSIQIDETTDADIESDTELQLKAVPYTNGSVTDNASFEWTSSDISIAAVDNTGRVFCLSEGNVKITARWIEKDISESIFITVGKADQPPKQAYNYGISGNKNLRCGYSRTYTLTITDKDGKEVNNTGCRWAVVSDFEVIQSIIGSKITLSVDNEDLIGCTFILQAVADGDVRAEMKIIVVE